MPRFGIKTKQRRKSKVGGFHAEYFDNRTAIRQRKQVGFLRSCFTAMSLLFGGGMIYVALHYVPAVVKPADVLKVVTTDAPRPTKDNFSERSIIGKTLGPYLDMFTLERSYMKAGQSVDVKYALPAGSRMDVKIKQCRRLWIVEVFTCQLVSEQSLRVDGHNGNQRFTLGATGFYHFTERVTLPDPNASYRVIWKRS